MQLRLEIIAAPIYLYLLADISGFYISGVLANGRSQPAQRTIEPALAGTKDHRAGSARWLSDLSGSCDSRRGALAIERRGALDIESVQGDLPPLERGFAGWQFACAVPVEPGGGAALGVLLVDRLSGVVELEDVGEDGEADLQLRR